MPNARMSDTKSVAVVPDSVTVTGVVNVAEFFWLTLTVNWLPVVNVGLARPSITVAPVAALSNSLYVAVPF